MPDKSKLSLIIPFLNEENNLSALFSKLVKVLEDIDEEYEIIFIDDGSTDSSLDIIREMKSANPAIKCLSFSRNFGHQIALFAGIKESNGDIVITMDADLQHPPAVIHELIKMQRAGYNVVNTKRIDSDRISFFKKATSIIFYKIINLLSDVYIEPASSDFRLMDRLAVNGFLEIQERDRFNRGLVKWMGFKQGLVEYYAPPRLSGTSKYTIRKMFHFALDGVTAFSSKPLRISFYLGLLTFLAGLIYTFFAIIQYFRGDTIQGWTSILVSVLIIGGIQLLSLGIIGEYIARIFNESKRRPVYLIKEKF